ncbi:hypothetical protein OG937_22890 [Streptomyces sp. NBC_00510]
MPNRSSGSDALGTDGVVVTVAVDVPDGCGRAVPGQRTSAHLRVDVDQAAGPAWVLPGTSTRPTGKGSVELTAAKLGVAGEYPQVGGFQPS